MHFTILLPHYKTGEMSAYSISRMLALQGRHTVNIIVIDNSNGIGVDLIPKSEDVKVIHYPENLLQSHGIAFDYALRNHSESISDHFITVESDSFPMNDRWLDHYEGYVGEGYDIAGSKLKLSGGTYIHPAGAMYSKWNWLEAKNDVERYGYNFYESAVPPCYHVMTKGFMNIPDVKRSRFLPIAESVFHQGMGFADENVTTYGARTPESDAPTILPRDGADRYLRVMYEPGQWLCYWHFAKGKKIKEIPTEVKWLPNRENQNQEFTLNEAGFKHLWGITAYHDHKDEELSEVIEFKRKQARELYETLEK